MPDQRLSEADQIDNDEQQSSAQENSTLNFVRMLLESADYAPTDPSERDRVENLLSTLVAQGEMNRQGPQIAEPTTGLRYADVYRNFTRPVLLETHSFAQAFWRTSKISREAQIKLVNKWISNMCFHIETDPCTFIFEDNEEKYKQVGGGVYEPTLRTIYQFHKISFVTLLHEFRHFMQHECLNDLHIYKDDIEEDARAWSLSLFKMAAPKKYEHAVEKGLIVWA